MRSQKGPTWWATAVRLAKKAPGLWRQARGRLGGAAGWAPGAWRSAQAGLRGLLPGRANRVGDESTELSASKGSRRASAAGGGGDDFIQAIQAKAHSEAEAGRGADGALLDRDSMGRDSLSEQPLLPPPETAPRRPPIQFRASVLSGDGQDEFELRDLAAERRADADQFL
jgi:hypothetical protein